MVSTIVWTLVQKLEKASVLLPGSMTERQGWGGTSEDFFWLCIWPWGEFRGIVLLGWQETVKWQSKVMNNHTYTTWVPEASHHNAAMVRRVAKCFHSLQLLFINYLFPACLFPTEKAVGERNINTTGPKQMSWGGLLSLLKCDCCLWGSMGRVGPAGSCAKATNMKGPVL